MNMDSPFFDIITNPKRRLICQQATSLLIEHSYNGTSIKSIAHASGMEKPSLYYYFRKKIELAKYLMKQLLYYAEQKYFSMRNLKQLTQLYQDVRQCKSLSVEQKVLFLLPSRLTPTKDPQLQKQINHYFQEWLKFFEHANSSQKSSTIQFDFYQYYGKISLHVMLTKKITS